MKKIGMTLIAMLTAISFFGCCATDGKSCEESKKTAAPEVKKAAVPAPAEPAAVPKKADDKKAAPKAVKKAAQKTAPKAVKKAVKKPAAKAAAKKAVVRTRIFLAGDSTCASYPAKRAPLTGWGQVLSEYSKADVRINNRARSGASTKSYIYSNHWKRLLPLVKAGDFVVIQFGHNDGTANKRSKKYTSIEEYKKNLKRFIADVKAQKATPVIATSIVRCVFKNKKIAADGLLKYRDAAIEVAKAENVPLIDMNKITREKFSAMGEKKAFSMYLGKVAPVQRKVAAKPQRAKKAVPPVVTTSQIVVAHNNSPAAVEKIAQMSRKKKTAVRPARKPRIDRTHLNKDGAKLVAQWFVEECKQQNLPIGNCFK